MRTIWLVIKHDIRATMGQPSFWILTMLVPVLFLALNGFALVRANAVAGVGDAEEAESAPPAQRAIGLVDEGGLVTERPEAIPPDTFVRFNDLESARAALVANQVEQVVVIPADYVASGDVPVYDQDFQLLRSGEGAGVAFESDRAWMLRYLLDYNLTGDEQLTAALHNPTPGNLAERHILNPAQQRPGQDQALAELVAQLMPYVFYFLLIMGSNYLMRAVVAEKENRTAEVLLVSLDPRDLMVGKILANSVLLAMQVVVWLGGALLIVDRGAVALQVAEFSFPPGFFVWALLFLLLGYLLFAALMAAAGAISTSAREAAPMTILIIIPLMPTLMFGAEFVDNPDGALAMVLSLFPFSAPSAMVTRLAVASVPLWQIALSLALLAVTAYGFVVLAARFFRAGNLLSDASFSWQRLATGWRR